MTVTLSHSDSVSSGGGNMRRKASTVTPRGLGFATTTQSAEALDISGARLVPEEDEVPDIAAIMQEQLEQLASQLDALRDENGELKRPMAEVRDRNAAQLAAVSDRVKALEAQLQRMEVPQRAENIVIHGLEEQEGVTALVALARACRDVGPPEPSWREVFRLGKERRGPDSRPRPILVKFHSMEAKHQLFSRSRALRDRQVYLDDDLTPAQQATRRSLAGEYQKLKMAKLRPFYRQDRLLYVHRGKVVQHQAGMALPTGSPGPQGPIQNRVPAKAPCCREPKSGRADDGIMLVAIKSVESCQVPRCRHEKIVDGRNTRRGKHLRILLQPTGLD